jgi:hypothetical protein
MKYAEHILLCAVIGFVVYMLASIFWRYLFPRVQMEREARALLKQHPGAEQTSVYLSLHSILPSKKKQEIDAKITEMQAQGWTFLRAMEANPLRTICSLGGGLTLHFIRTYD